MIHVRSEEVRDYPDERGAERQTKLSRRSDKGMTESRELKM